MKNPIYSFLLLASIFTQNAFGSTSQYTYQCAKNVRLDVIFSAKGVVIFQQYPSGQGKRVINVYSDPQKNPSTENDPEIVKQTGLKSYISFAGFHYPDGRMLITAEQDTNEEGYALVLDPSILKGARTVQAAEQYWSEWNENPFYAFTCVRTK